MALIPEAWIRVGIKDNTKKSTRNIKSNMAGMASAARKLIPALAAVAGVTGLGAMIKSSIDAGDRLQKLSIRLGASTEALSEYEHVAKLTGVSFQTLTLGMQRATRRISEAANGTGEAKDALIELGLSAADLEKLRPEQQFEAIADAMMGVEDQSDKVRLAMKLFDTEGVALLQTMKGGSGAMKEMRAEAQKLGLTISRDQANAMAAANDAMTRFKAAFQGVANQLAISILPALTDTINLLADNLPKALEFASNAWRMFRDITNRIAGTIFTYLENLYGLFAKIPKAINPLQGAFQTLSEKAGEMSQRLAEDNYEINRLDKKQKQFTRTLDESQKGMGVYVDGLKEKIEAEEKSNELLEEALGIIDRYKTKMEEAGEEMLVLKDAVEKGLITQEQFSETALRITEDMDDSLKDVQDDLKDNESAAKEFGLIMSSSLEEAIVNFQDLRGVAQGFIDDLSKMLIRKQLTEPLAEFMGSFDFGSIFGGGGGGFDIGGIISSFFEGGGVMSGRGSLPLRAYAGGGVADSPQLAVFGEGSTPEAFVPVPSGKIPVEMNGGGGGTYNINVNVGAGESPDAIANKVSSSVVRAIRSMNQKDRGMSRDQELTELGQKLTQATRRSL